MMKSNLKKKIRLVGNINLSRGETTERVKLKLSEH